MHMGRVNRQDRGGRYATRCIDLPVRRGLQRLRSKMAGNPPRCVDAAPMAASRIHADTLLALRLSSLAQHFPALCTQLRLALYLDRGGLLLLIAAVLDAYVVENVNPGQRRERRDLQPVLAHLQELLAEPLSAECLSRRSG